MCILLICRLSTISSRTHLLDENTAHDTSLRHRARTLSAELVDPANNRSVMNSMFVRPLHPCVNMRRLLAVLSAFAVLSSKLQLVRPFSVNVVCQVGYVTGEYEASRAEEDCRTKERLFRIFNIGCLPVGGACFRLVYVE